MSTHELTSSDNVIQFKQLNLTERIPLADPGGYFTYLLHSIRVVELECEVQSPSLFSNLARSASQSTGANFLLMDVGKCSCLRDSLKSLSSFSKKAALSDGAELVFFGNTEIALPRELLAYPDRESAISGSGMLPKNWSMCYESLEANFGQGDFHDQEA